MRQVVDEHVLRDWLREERQKDTCHWSVRDFIDRLLSILSDFAPVVQPPQPPAPLAQLQALAMKLGSIDVLAMQIEHKQGDAVTWAVAIREKVREAFASTHVPARTCETCVFAGRPITRSGKPCRFCKGLEVDGMAFTVVPLLNRDGQPFCCALHTPTQEVRGG